MQSKSKMFDDLARLANGATGVFGGLREEVEAMIRQKMEHALTDMDLVSREEFEAMRAVAVEARTRQEELEERLAALEAKLAEKIESE